MITCTPTAINGADFAKWDAIPGGRQTIPGGRTTLAARAAVAFCPSILAFLRAPRFSTSIAITFVRHFLSRVVGDFVPIARWFFTMIQIVTRRSQIQDENFKLHVFLDTFGFRYFGSG